MVKSNDSARDAWIREQEFDTLSECFTASKAWDAAMAHFSAQANEAFETWAVVGKGLSLEKHSGAYRSVSTWAANLGWQAALTWRNESVPGTMDYRSQKPAGGPEICTNCGGYLDTGMECNDCGLLSHDECSECVKFTDFLQIGQLPFDRFMQEHKDYKGILELLCQERLKTESLLQVEENLGRAIQALIRGDIKCSDDLPVDKRPQSVGACRGFGAVYDYIRKHPAEQRKEVEHGDDT